VSRGRPNDSPTDPPTHTRNPHQHACASLRPTDPHPTWAGKNSKARHPDLALLKAKHTTTTADCLRELPGQSLVSLGHRRPLHTVTQAQRPGVWSSSAPGRPAGTLDVCPPARGWAMQNSEFMRCRPGLQHTRSLPPRTRVGPCGSEFMRPRPPCRRTNGSPPLARVGPCSYAESKDAPYTALCARSACALTLAGRALPLAPPQPSLLGWSALSCSLASTQLGLAPLSCRVGAAAPLLRPIAQQPPLPSPAPCCSCCSRCSG
jgi:hypothetical protein